jgi:flagellar biosynthesis regulator FlaF
MTDSITLDDLKPGEQDAFGLVQAAVALDSARNDSAALAAALDHNMQLWVAIGTLAESPTNSLPATVKDNLVRLSKFVSETTLAHGVSIAQDALTTLININLQISEGLLEGCAKG